MYYIYGRHMDWIYMFIIIFIVINQLISAASAGQEAYIYWNYCAGQIFLQDVLNTVSMNKLVHKHFLKHWIICVVYAWIILIAQFYYDYWLVNFYMHEIQTYLIGCIIRKIRVYLKSNSNLFSISYLENYL